LAGAVIGSQIAKGSRNSYYGYRRGGTSSTTGALIGGALGAIVGSEVSKRSC